MNELAIETVMRYIDKHLFEPKNNWSKVEFSRRSYSRWAAYEILELLMDNPFDDSEMIINGFIMKMLYCSYVAENKEKPSFVFTTAIDVANDILILSRR